MPRFDYYCYDCEAIESNVSQPYPPANFRECECGHASVRLAPRVTVWDSWENRPPIDDPKEIFRDMPGLADSDGINQVQYKSKRSTFEMGKR